MCYKAAVDITNYFIVPKEWTINMVQYWTHPPKHNSNKLPLIYWLSDQFYGTVAVMCVPCQAYRGGGDSYRTSSESEMSVDEEQPPEELWSRKASHCSSFLF